MTVKGKQYFKGYKGVTVCERWHNFQHFCDDLPKLMAMPAGKITPENMSWIKIFHIVVLFPDTVSFISTMENAKEAALRRSAMKILSQHYHEVNKIRNEIVMDTEDELRKTILFMKLHITGILKSLSQKHPMVRWHSIP
jgi:hypothetical protein